MNPDLHICAREGKTPTLPSGVADSRREEQGVADCAPFGEMRNCVTILNMSIPLSPVNINNCCYDTFPDVSNDDDEPRTRGLHVDMVGIISNADSTFHPQYVGTTIHFRKPVVNDEADFITPLKMPENIYADKDDNNVNSSDSCSKLELAREPRSCFQHRDDYESSYKTMDPLFEMIFKPLDHPDFQPTPELERFDALLERNAHIELQPYSELDPKSMIFNYDVYLKRSNALKLSEFSKHNLYRCNCCNDIHWEKAREADFSMIRRSLGKTPIQEGVIDSYICDCETCVTWNTEELDNFNSNNEIGCFITSIGEYEKLQLFSKKVQLSLIDGVCYSTYCHYCCKEMNEERYDKLYCCDECENAVEVKCEQCIYSETLCKICDYKDNGTFNIRYGVNYNKEDIDTTLNYAKEHDLTIYEAMEYLSVCHFCGRDTTYAHYYCKARCQDLAEDFNYECFRGKDCKVCNNYAICCGKRSLPY